ncbi:helix-turn-helix domain-containing protein [Streptomyces nigra]
MVDGKHLLFSSLRMTRETGVTETAPELGISRTTAHRILLTL